MARLDADDVRRRLLATFRWGGDRGSRSEYADRSGWWRDAQLLSAIGPALAGLFGDAQPDAVLGVESSGMLVGPLVAAELGVGFVAVRRRLPSVADSDTWLRRRTPPDYTGRQLTLGFPRARLDAGERVLFADDWVDTGGQALGVQALVDDAHAVWLGSAVIVDALADHDARRRLGVRSLLRVRDL